MIPLRRCVFALVLCLSLPAVGADGDAGSTSLRRFTIVVSDLERARRLWCGVFAMNAGTVIEGEPLALSYAFFDIPRTARLRFLSLDSDQRPRELGLLEVSGITLPAAAGIRRSAPVLRLFRPWEDVRADLKDLGLSMIRETTMQTPDGREGREAAVVDWDGNLIVIYRLAPDGRDTHAGGSAVGGNPAKGF